MHRSGKSLPGAALLAAALVAAPPLAAQHPPVVIDRARQAELIDELALTGTLTSPHHATLATEVEGRVAGLAVEAGARVAEGDTLAELDDALVQTDLQRARAARREAEAALADARRRLREARSLARQASVAESEVRTRETEVERAEAVLARRQAELSRQEKLLERHTLRAPFDGVISRRLADVGEWVGPGTAVFELVAVDRLRLDLQVPQSYFGRIGSETDVTVEIDALPGEPRDTQVAAVVPVNDPRARTFLSRVRLDNADGRLAPGMSARATLRIATGRRGVVISRDALIRYPDGRTVVWVAEGEGETRTVRERPVRTGLKFDGRVAVTDGLQAGTPVVTRGNEALQDGQTVRLTDGG